MTYDANPVITELEVEYNVEFNGGEYDGLKFHFLNPEPPYEWVLSDIRASGKRIRRAECRYRQEGIYVLRKPSPDDEPSAVEWSCGFMDDSLPCTHIHTLLPLHVDEIREVYPEVLVWHNREECGLVVLHATYYLATEK